MLNTAKSMIGGMAVAAMVAAGSIAAVPTAQAEPGYSGAKVELVAQKKRGKGNNWRNDNWRNNGRWHRNNNNNWIAPLGLFGAGVFVGTLLNNHPPARTTYYRHGYKGYPSRDAYCHANYISYKSWTGTFTGYDGFEHYCR